jgi:hypothetical protein
MLTKNININLTLCLKHEFIRFICIQLNLLYSINIKWLTHLLNMLHYILKTTTFCFKNIVLILFLTLALDECTNKPCGNHTCVNMVNDFSCICHGEMTGDLCDVPPDYCINNQCIQGECQSGNGTYSCTCNNGYTGVFCDIPPGKMLILNHQVFFSKGIQ